MHYIPAVGRIQGGGWAGNADVLNYLPEVNETKVRHVAIHGNPRTQATEERVCNR